jgi:DNA invertase Pin-like site-specific DNA recombinase
MTACKNRKEITEMKTAKTAEITTYKAIVYISLSNADDKKDENGKKIENAESDSVANQRKLIRDWAKSHPDIEIVAEKVDDGYSGLTFLERPAFQEMMAEIEAGRIDCCITKDLSRLGREYIETGRYLRRVFPAYGVQFIAINNKIDTLNDNADDLTVSLQTIMNDGYSRNISISTRSALRTKREHGDYIGACPVYGYRKSVDDKNKLVPDDYPASVVREIFRMKLDGQSAARIATVLNGRGVLSPYMYKKDRGIAQPYGNFADKEDAKWCAHTIIRILADEVYIGTLVQGKVGTPNYKLKEVMAKPEDEWQRTENAHEPIIDKRDFELVQRLSRLDTRTSPHGETVYPFSGILICGSCGNRMTRATRKIAGKTYHYYLCPTTKKKGCQSEGMIKESDLMGVVLERVKDRVSSVTNLEVLLQSLDVERVGRGIADGLTKQVEENERRLDKIRRFQSGLYENMMNGVLSKEEHKTLKGKYNDDADAIIVANERLINEINDALSCKHERLAWTQHFKQFANLEAIDRKTVVNLISAIRVLNKTDIEIIFNFQAELETALALLAEGRSA